MLVSYIVLLETAPNTQNIQKFTKKHEMIENWTIDGAQQQLKKNWWTRHKYPYEQVGQKNQQKSKSLSSPEQNYLFIFAMRYPVRQNRSVN